MTRSIDRRRFLGLSAIAAVGRKPGFLGNPVSSNQDTDPIVVVGAGLAGLHAADLLRKAGRTVVVLEARSVAGGRVRTIHAPFSEGLHAEAGAIRIGGMHRTVLQLIRDHALTLVPFASADGSPVVSIGGATVRVGQPVPESAGLNLRPDEVGLSQGALLQRYVSDLPSDIGELAPTAAQYASWAALDRQTWPDWLKSRGASDDATRMMTIGGDSRELSALYVVRQFVLLQNATQFYKIQGGMDLLPRRMAEALGPLVRYNTAVTRVDRSGTALRVDYVENGRAAAVRASRVVFTVPFSTLRQIEIRPPFSAERARAIDGLSYFPATRFLLQSRRRFWNAAGLNGFARTDQPAEVWDASHDLRGTRGILAATVGGEIGRSLTRMTEALSLKLGRDLVAKTFPKMATEFERGTVCRWELEPWSKGAFAVFRPGEMTTLMPAIAQAEDRMHFAGEHTSSWMGWMEGALESGARAAREILTGASRAEVDR